MYTHGMVMVMLMLGKTDYKVVLIFIPEKEVKCYSLLYDLVLKSKFI